jgi:hypothetical protein
MGQFGLRVKSVTGVKLVIWGILAIVLANCTSKDCCGSPQEERNANQERGTMIIRAIERYEREQGDAPERLDILIPQYLSAIPLTAADNDFVYQPGDMYDEWTLTFEVTSNDTGCTYISHFEYWDCWPPNAGDH